MPPAHPVTKGRGVALLLGLALLVAPTLLGLEHTTPVNLLGVLSILGGVGLLVSRLSERSSDDYEGPDDGAVVCPAQVAASSTGPACSSGRVPIRSSRCSSISSASRSGWSIAANAAHSGSVT